jgi:hypothetical protein
MPICPSRLYIELICRGKEKEEKQADFILDILFENVKWSELPGMHFSV